MIKKTLITIIGNVGAGKSTLTHLLSKYFLYDLIEADDLFQTQNPFAKMYLSDMKAWAFKNEVWMTYHRVQLLMDKIRKMRTKHAFVDGGVLMNWVYAYSHNKAGNLAEIEWDLYKKIYDLIVKKLKKYNQLVIYMNYSLDTLHKRIKKRGRSYELELYSREFLRNLDIGLKELKSKLIVTKTPTLLIEEHEAPDFENNAKDLKLIIERVKKLIAPPDYTPRVSFNYT